MLILLLFAAWVNSILPVLLLSQCYDSYSCCFFTPLLPKYDCETPLLIILICVSLSLPLESAILLPICLVRLGFIGKISMFASGPVHGPLLCVFRTLEGRDVFTDEYSYLGSLYYSCSSQAKPVLLLRSIILNGTKITFIN